MRRIANLLSCLLLSLLPACGSDSNDPGEPDPLAVTAVSPADGADAVPFGVSVTATFNRPLDPATLNAATFRLRAGGNPLPAGVTYDDATRTARLVAPLLPLGQYQVDLAEGITDEDGGPLSAPEEWTFTTGAPRAVAAEADGSAGFTASLTLDGDGVRHVAHYEQIGSRLRYSTCSADCTSAASWSGVTVDEDGIVGLNPSIVADANGGLHVTYVDGINEDLKYATCAADCTNAANWTTVAVDEPGNVGLYGTLAIGSNGRLHASYYDLDNGELKYATCGGECTDAGNWTSGGIDLTAGGGFSASIAIDGTGRLHIGYHEFTAASLKYATCAAGCTTDANWTAITIDDLGIYSSLKADPSGGIHIAYRRNDELRYIGCASECTTEANWTSVIVDGTGNAGRFASLALDDGGRLHISYYDDTNADLMYATCAAACTTEGGWQTAGLDQNGQVGQYTSIAVDGTGRVAVAYQGQDDMDLRYLE